MEWVILFVVVAVFVAYRISRSIDDRKRAQRRAAEVAAEQARRQQYVAPTAVIARRRSAESTHVEDGRAAVSVKAVKGSTGKWHGAVVTASGKVLWTCKTGHSRRGVRRRYGRSTTSLEASQEAARECARKELSANRRQYEAMAGAAVGSNNPRVGRADIESHGYDSWSELVTAFGGCCAYCGARTTRLHKDHVIPLAKGGKNDFTNVLPACQRCNLDKGTKRLEDFLRQREALGIPTSQWFP